MSETDATSPLSGDTDTRDTVARFAADLRRLRLEADSPTLSKLQTLTGISRSVLSDAFAGRQLPSARTVDRIARACDVDSASWLERRDALLGGTPTTIEEAAAATESVEPARPSIKRATALWLAAGSFAVGVAASVAVTLVLVPLLVVAPTDTASPLIQVENGLDPAQTECVNDAAVATGDTRADNSLLEIVWSDKCQAGWGRITRYDGLSNGNTVSIAIYPQTAPQGPDRQDVTEHDVQGAYTGLVVRPSDDTLLCAEGSFTIDGTRIDLGDPLCI